MGGTLRPGDQVGFVPSNLKGKKIFSIEQHKKVLESAGPGNSVGLSIKGIAKDEKVNPGDIIYNEKDGEPKPIKSFTAWLPSRNTLVSSSLDTALLSSLV